MIIHPPRSKAKVKKKPGWQQREAEYNAWLKSVGVDPIAKKSRTREFVPLTTKQEVYRRETQHIPSLSSKNSMVGSTAKRETQQYTGDYLVGIATMHKSNLVPVGRGDNPEAYATMRRG